MPQSGSAQIAFASNRDGSAQIYSMNTDGSGSSRLTNDAANDECPRWSPNNSRIVFQSDRDNLFSGIADIYVMNADGSGQTRLTNDPADDSAPAWSPDGTKIAFRSDRERDCCDPVEQVWTMNADGTSQVDLSNNAFGDYCPSWSHSTSNVPPAVSITSPTNGATFTALANITITANASDSDGWISRVDFYQGASLIGTATTAPYTVVLNNVASGSYSLTAKATDNGGAIGTSNAVTVTVNPPNQPPVANAGGPYNGTAGQSVQFNGGGSTDPDGTITSYQWSFGDNPPSPSATPPPTTPTP